MAADRDRDELASQFSFALYGAANRVVRLHKPILEPLGLTFPQYLVVAELLDEAPQTVGELRGRLHWDTGSLTPVLKRLEAAGVLTRTRDRADERRVLVELTETGRALESGVRGVNDKVRSACRISDDEARELVRILRDIGHPAE